MTMRMAMLAAGLAFSMTAMGQAGPSSPVPTGDAAAGRTLFRQCVACHGVAGAGTAAGPDLRGIVGQAAAAQPDFAYSAALRRSRKLWTQAELTAFLVKPQAAVPGTRMAYPGAGSPAKAAALAAYLATLR